MHMFVFDLVVKVMATSLAKQDFWNLVLSG